MKTFKGTLNIDFSIVVTEQFIEARRAQAKAEDTSVFLKRTDAEHPVNDEAFIEALLKNTIRRHVRESIAELCAGSGLGARIAPATIELIGLVPEHDAPVTVQEVLVERKAEMNPLHAAPYGTLAQEFAEHQLDPT